MKIILFFFIYIFLEKENLNNYEFVCSNYCSTNNRESNSSNIFKIICILKLSLKICIILFNEENFKQAIIFV